MLTYSASELRQLRRNDATVTRPAKKVIFILHLWCQRSMHEGHLDQCIEKIPIVTVNRRRTDLVTNTSCVRPHYARRPRVLHVIDTIDDTESATTPDTSRSSLLSLPTLHVFNAASYAKRSAVEQLTTMLTGYSIDIAVISESHSKKKHANSCFQVDGYSLFRRNRTGRKANGVAIYVRQSLAAMIVADFQSRSELRNIVDPDRVEKRRIIRLRAVPPAVANL
jgi:hypothetical protein